MRIARAAADASQGLTNLRGVAAPPRVSRLDDVAERPRRRGSASRRGGSVQQCSRVEGCT